jgi:hypothetical protein
MTYIYYIDGKKYIDENYNDNLNGYISSPNEETPAIENLSISYKYWCKKGFIWHRLIGPAYIDYYGTEVFWLNGNYYKNVHTWLEAHPNLSLIHI